MPITNHSWKQITDAYLTGADQRSALISLVSKTGSSYLQPGARLLVHEDGRYWGEISAGCLEAKVTAQARECMLTGKHRLLSIDTRPLYGCFGSITLLIEVIHDRTQFRELMQQISRAAQQRLPLDIVTDYRDLDCLRLTQVSTETIDHPQVLEETTTPPVQLLVLGDWPDGTAALKISQQLGWDAVLYDASAPSFSIEDCVKQRCIDAQTAILVATHNLARDVSCLTKTLLCGAGYIGVIGSHKRRSEIARHMAEYDNFLLLESFEQVHCPAGLDIGGQGASAIALSVIAEIQSQLAQRSAQPLDERISPIHLEDAHL